MIARREQELTTYREASQSIESGLLKSTAGLVVREGFGNRWPSIGGYIPCAAIFEVATGAALLLVPSLVGLLLFGVQLTGITITVARATGLALIWLGINASLRFFERFAGLDAQRAAGRLDACQQSYRQHHRRCDQKRTGHVSDSGFL